ncbi:hypothetical protein Lacidipiscis_02434 [Ligilactobacillus acidipiscis]|uniref:hypothetical protein n=1 Tax=Ligilactobacillus acidipiscis TaxID=89059 RepID=UPI000A2632F5|nr:hypothetical protein Lacidipiscis_02434 [Ligilactobacillus acidipiscis]
MALGARNNNHTNTDINSDNAQEIAKLINSEVYDALANHELISQEHTPHLMNLIATIVTQEVVNSDLKNEIKNIAYNSTQDVVRQEMTDFSQYIAQNKHDVDSTAKKAQAQMGKYADEHIQAKKKITSSFLKLHRELKSQGDNAVKDVQNKAQKLSGLIRDLDITKLKEEAEQTKQRVEQNKKELTYSLLISSGIGCFVGLVLGIILF